MIQEKTIEKKLSRAAIETLAIIVYHQPVTRAEIEEIREARKLFTVSMRDMADAGRLDLKDVNSKFAQRNSPTEVAA